MKTHSTLHKLFEEQVAVNQDRTAVEFNKKKVSYSDLNNRANSLASYLVQNGLNTEDHVFIALDKSIEFIISLYGVLKAGGAYVPLDPDYPDQKIIDLLDEVKPKIIVTQSRYLAKFNKYTNAYIICIDKFQFVSLSKHASLPIVKPKNLAYTIFTSGTTGKPKGVMIEHKSVVNTIVSLIDRYYINKNSRLLQFANQTFDSSVAEIFSVLSAGGVLVLVSDLNLKNLSKLNILLDKLKISCVTLPSALLMHMDFSQNRYLKTLISAGSNLSVKISNRVYKQVPHFINAYGPTECSICVCTYEIKTVLIDFVPIGTPLPNTKIVVLNSLKRRVPFGSKGIMYVAGLGLARGYYKNKKTTREAFVKLPFEKNTRFYKTNDLVKQVSDSNYIFIKRSDRQEKIRGVRIELEEIENVMHNISDVQSAVALVEIDNRGEEALTCYFTSEKHISVSDIRNVFKLKVSKNSIPNNFIQIVEMPLNRSGKIDTSKLSSLRNTLYAKHINPVRANHNEQIIIILWSKFFDKRDIHINDNFFELGGDSLLAMRLVSEINAELNIDIDILSIFENPVLSEFVNNVVVKKLSADKRYTESKKKQECFPLSSAQTMFWIAYQLDPNSQSNNIVKILNSIRDLDVDLLQKSFDNLLQRYEILRTVFLEKKGIPFQKIKNESTNTIKFIKVEERLMVDYEIKKAASKVFNLEKDDLIEITVLKYANNSYKIILVMHHIIFDAVSFNIFISELFSSYKLLKNKKKLNNVDTKFKFTDFIEWEKKQQDTNKFKEMEKYWVSELGDSISRIELPVDNLENYVASSNGSILAFSLLPTLSKRINEAAKLLRVTSYMFLLSAFSIFIHRYSGQDDINIGTPVSLRNKKELQSLIGPLINTIVIRSRINGSVTFEEFLQKQKKVIFNAIKNSEYPFEKIVEKISSGRNNAKNPLFNVMFDYVKEQTEAGIYNNRKIETYNTRTSKFDLTFSLIEENKTNIRLEAEYNTNLFNEATIQRMLENFSFFLYSLTQNYKENIFEIKLISDKEYNLVTQVFNNTTKEQPKLSYIEVFEKQVHKFPNKVAVECNEEKITYKELNEKANQLANELILHKVDIDMPVAVLMERSIDLIISMIAIWKSGGIYVPVDIEYPKSRIYEIFRKSKITIVLTKQKYLSFISRKQYGIDVESIYNNNKRFFKKRKNYPMSSLAYIIFTSGSTGKPKGVMIEQRGMMNHMQIMIKYFKLNKESIIAQNASQSFDISIWQLACALLAGGKTVIYSKDIILNPVLFLKKIQKDQVSVLEMVPSLLSILLEIVEFSEHEKKALSGLKLIIVTGEAVKSALINRWFKIYPNKKLINAYGPAEASDDTNFCELEKDLSVNTPIGKPLDNITEYILDERRNVCPIGVKGEIYIAGISIGRGYVNDAVKTKEVFLKDFISKKKNTRMYKTGDIGRWKEDGNIEFFGRTDSQVKIHGFRIELGEVEHQLLKFETIKNVVVVDQEDKAQDKHLVAYYESVFEIPTKEIQAFLLKRLPYYMVPSRFIKFDKLPLNNNGKVDRRYLKSQVFNQEKDRPKKVIWSENEKIIANVWKDILMVDSLSQNDNFFEKGGDSIHSLKIVSKLREKGFIVTVKDIFQHQSIYDLALNIRRLKHSNTKRIKKTTHGIFPLTPIQRDFVNQNTTYSNTYSQILSMECKTIDQEALSVALMKLQEYHDALRIRLVNRDECIQMYTSEILDVLSVYDFSRETTSDKKINTLINNTQKELNIFNGPIIRAVLIKLEGNYKLILIIHHFVVDIFSWKFILGDLESIYLQLKGIKNRELEPKNSSYKDWAEELQKYAQGDTLADEIPYWDHITSQIKNVIPISSNNNIENNATRKLIAFDLKVDKDILLGSNSLNKGETFQTLILTALCITLGSYRNTSEVVLMIESHGRTDVFSNLDIARTVGWFTSSYPVIFKVGNKGHLNQMKTIENALLSIPVNGIGYGVLKHMSAKNNFSQIKHEDPQVIFNFLGDISSKSSNSLFNNISIVQDDTINSIYSKSPLIEVDGYITKNKLVVEVRYASCYYSKRSMKYMTDQFKKELENIIKDLTNNHHSKNASFDLINIKRERMYEISKKLNNS